MIKYEKYSLKNGLRVLVHVDKTTPLAALNLVYDVGSRDEDPNRTGFAHLFEHLMFGGSKNIPDYDTPLQNACGENNAFTSNDITNYYLTIPVENIETGFWLESDRMLELDFSQHSIDVQRNVVIEEFKQRYLNQPYGDVSLLLRDMAFESHPYKWPTIGKEIDHIKYASLDDVKRFFYTHYAPNNAVLVVSGNVDPIAIFQLAEKWFGEIPSRDVPVRNLPVEPVQLKKRFLEVERKVPYDAIYMAFHMGAKFDANYFVSDLISDVLSNGDSSRLYRKLVLEKGMFSELDAYISGDCDPGLFYVSGKLMQGVQLEDAEKAIWEELIKMKEEDISEYELNKVVNKVVANIEYSEISYLHKAMNLAALELMGMVDLVNQQEEKYRDVTIDKMKMVSQDIFREENCSTLYYRSKK